MNTMLHEMKNMKVDIKDILHDVQNLQLRVRSLETINRRSGLETSNRHSRESDLW